MKPKYILIFTFKNFRIIKNCTAIFVLSMALASCGAETNPSKTIHSEPKEEKESPRFKQKIVLANHTNLADSCFQEIYVYNAEGNLSEKFRFSDCGIISEVHTYGYRKDQVLESSIHKADKEVTYQWIYEENSQVQDLLALNQTTEFPYRIEFSYNQEGQLIEKRSLMAADSLSHKNKLETFEYENKLLKKTQVYLGEDSETFSHEIEHYYKNDGTEYLQVRREGLNRVPTDSNEVLVKFF